MQKMGLGHVVVDEIDDAGDILIEELAFERESPTL
jgi:hypothetical protein